MDGGSRVQGGASWCGAADGPFFGDTGAATPNHKALPDRVAFLLNSKPHRRTAELLAGEFVYGVFEIAEGAAFAANPLIKRLYAEAAAAPLEIATARSKS